MAEPIQIRVFRGDGCVLAAEDVPEPFDGMGQIHNDRNFSRWGGAKAVQGAISNFNIRTSTSINEPFTVHQMDSCAGNKENPNPRLRGQKQKISTPLF
jgi:hypothetical protein